MREEEEGDTGDAKEEMELDSEMSEYEGEGSMRGCGMPMLDG